MNTFSPQNLSEMPREKAARNGIEALSDTELVALILGSGGKGVPLLTLAEQVLALIDDKGAEITMKDLSSVPHIGPARATLLLGVFEFVRRRISPHGVKIRKASDVLPLLQHWQDRNQECFIVLTLNGAHEVLSKKLITIGLANTTQVHPREVFSCAIADRACAIIVAHNHPSGDTTPSESDRSVTKRLVEAGDLLGIKLLDHIIFSTRGFYSFCEAGDCY